MKMFYGNVPVDSMKIKHYEISTNDCTAIPSDLQSGVTCVSKGKKITGTGKAFSFASYGGWKTNLSNIIPVIVNVVYIGCVNYPIKMTAPLGDTMHYDFSVVQKIAEVIIDNISYPITASVQNNEFIINCEKTIDIELFIGRDEYL